MSKPHMTIIDRRRVWRVRQNAFSLFTDLPALHVERWIVPKRWRRLGTKIHFEDVRNERI